jgi:molybdopterin synthase sulfur carrier subunit
MNVRIRVPTALRELVGGAQTVAVDVGGDGSADPDVGPVTVGSVLDAIAVGYPALERRVRDELGRTRVHVNVFVGSDNVRDLDGLETRIAPGQELSIIPAISGG